MSLNEHVWVVVLAAGEGKRVMNLTFDRSGRPAPKQFSSIDGAATLLGATLERAKEISPPERIVPIVAAQHRHWWASELAEIPPGNVIVQPENRGTAAGILLPLLWITRHDPDATLVILPSDHDVACGDTLHLAILNAIHCAEQTEAGIVLLGVTPEGPETGYGWIVPCPAGCGCLLPVASFREKPDASVAASLFNDGALLNSFILIGNGRFLLDLFETALPQLWRSFQPVINGRWDASWRDRDFVRLYRSVPALDFSKDLLERAAQKLWVYPVPACGWLDLGTPERLTRHLIEKGQPPWGVGVKPTDRFWERGPHRVPQGMSDPRETIETVAGVTAQVGV